MFAELKEAKTQLAAYQAEAAEQNMEVETALDKKEEQVAIKTMMRELTNTAPAYALDFGGKVPENEWHAYMGRYNPTQVKQKKFKRKQQPEERNSGGQELSL